jgi:GT2 family glycosyltransferase
MSHLTTLSAADFTFVTVAYASASVIPDLWASLPAGARLIVVDNGPPDGMAAWARENGVLYVPMDTNVGFGAALVMKRDAFEAIKGFDPNIFLYFEDDDISTRFTSRFGEFILISDFELVHLGAAATAGIEGLSTFKEFHYGRSEIHVLMKHRGRAAAYWHFFLVLLRMCNFFEIANKQHRQRRIARLRGSISFFHTK